jgi:outer membrane protein assembly factor BamE (lipoprotein component of BamABCDE complex)
MKNCALILLVCLLASCQPQVNFRGNLIVEESFDTFVIGKTTASDVLRKCGTPSIHKDNFTWIYVGYMEEEDTLKNIKRVYEFIVKMTFDQNGLLKSVEKVDPKNNADILMDEEFTNLIDDANSNQTNDKDIDRKPS